MLSACRSMIRLWALRAQSGAALANPRFARMAIRSCAFGYPSAGRLPGSAGWWGSARLTAAQLTPSRGGRRSDLRPTSAACATFVVAVALAALAVLGAGLWGYHGFGFADLAVLAGELH